MYKIEYDIVYDKELPRTIMLGGGALGAERGLFIYEMSAKLVLDLLSNAKEKKLLGNKSLSSEDIENLTITAQTLSKCAKIFSTLLKGQNDAMDEINKILDKGDDEV